MSSLSKMDFTLLGKGWLKDKQFHAVGWQDAHPLRRKVRQCCCLPYTRKGPRPKLLSSWAPKVWPSPHCEEESHLVHQKWGNIISSQHRLTPRATKLHRGCHLHSQMLPEPRAAAYKRAFAKTGKPARPFHQEIKLSKRD